MTNKEIIVAINNINEFAGAEREAKTSKLPLSSELIVMENLNMLMEAYKPYMLTLNNINAKYTEEDLKNLNMAIKKNEEIAELQNTDRKDVKIKKKIKKSDFKEGTLLYDIMLLDFMEK